MPWKRAACGCLIAALAAACQPDSPSITEVEGTLDHHPEQPSCHFEPEAITTVEGDDEVVLIEFTYGGGATWWSSSPCHENPDSVTGVLLPADGVSFGDSVGADGDFIAQQDCAYSQADCVHNVPSPVNAIFIDALLGTSGYMTFDPPVSEVSFRVCSNQTHGLTAWDSLGNTIVPETVGPSNGFYQDGDLSCDPEGWEEFGIQASGYDISRLRLRRWDPGYTWWDDMTFRREASPGIECETKTRGEVATCSVIDSTGVESVTEWRFEGIDHDGAALDSAVVNTNHNDLGWTGKVVAEGVVMAELDRNGVTEVVAGSLKVSRREWRWSEDDPAGHVERQFIPGGGDKCGPWGALRVNRHGTPESVDLSLLTHIPTEVPCEIPYQFMLLPDLESDDGFELDRVQDLGPNDGLYFVTEGSWYLRLGSVLNPYILPGGPQEALPKKKAWQPCDGDLTPPDMASFYEFNVLCFDTQGAYDGFIDALWLHEGVGSRGLDATDPNGHWARIERAAKLPSGDPYNRVEPVVGTDPFDFLDDVEIRATNADVFLRTEANAAHVHVRDNWEPCGLINIYDTDQQEYDWLVFEDVAAAGGQPCP